MTSRETVPRRRVVRVVAVLAVPAAAYFVVRPAVDSDAVALAVAGALPLAYQLMLILIARRVDPWALVSGLGLVLACAISALTGGSSLPLKLHEAAITFLAGVGLLAAALLHRPAPLGKLLRVPDADRRLDASLSVLVGGFLVLHALLHLVLALLLPTSTYVVAGKIVNWATIAVGAAALWTYLRRLRGTAG